MCLLLLLLYCQYTMLLCIWGQHVKFFFFLFAILKIINQVNLSTQNLKWGSFSKKKFNASTNPDRGTGGTSWSRFINSINSGEDLLSLLEERHVVIPGVSLPTPPIPPPGETFPRFNFPFLRVTSAKRIRRQRGECDYYWITFEVSAVFFCARSPPWQPNQSTGRAEK